MVAAFLPLQLRHAAVRVVDVAEYDRLGRAGRLAGGLNLAVPHPAVLDFGRDLGAHDALEAERAFLHHAARTDGDFRVARELQAGRVPIPVKQVVEPANFPGAVVGAVARAYAAVVNLQVQPFGVVDRGVHWTDGLAGRGLAMLTHHRLEIDLRVGGPAAEVGVDPQPVHDAPPDDHLLADVRRVVFRLARDDAGVATGAGVHVNRHAPGVERSLPAVDGFRFFVIPVRVDRQLFARRVRAVMQNMRILLVFFERRRADDVAPDQVVALRDKGADIDAARVNVEMLLCRGQLVFAISLNNLNINISGSDEGRVDAADRVSVEAEAVADAARAVAPVTQKDRHRIVGMSRLNPGGHRQFPSFVDEPDHRRGGFSPFYVRIQRQFVRGVLA